MPPPPAPGSALLGKFIKLLPGLMHVAILSPRQSWDMGLQCALKPAL